MDVTADAGRFELDPSWLRRRLFAIAGSGRVTVQVFRTQLRLSVIREDVREGQKGVPQIVDLVEPRPGQNEAMAS